MTPATPHSDWPVDIWIAGERRTALRSPTGRGLSRAVDIVRTGVALPIHFFRRG